MTLKTGKALELVDQADRALYASKHRGRNRVTHQADLGDRPGAGGEPANDPERSQPPSFRMALPTPPRVHRRPVVVSSVRGGPGAACRPAMKSSRAGRARWYSAIARRSPTAARSPRRCWNWHGPSASTRPRWPISAAAPCSTTSARWASPTPSCTSPAPSPTRSGGSCGGTRGMPSSCWPRSTSWARRWRSPTAITSGGTAPATRAGSRASRSRWRRGPSPPWTSGTR